MNDIYNDLAAAVIESHGVYDPNEHIERLGEGVESLQTALEEEQYPGTQLGQVIARTFLLAVILDVDLRSQYEDEIERILDENYDQ